jgi:hypothetical protein
MEKRGIISRHPSAAGRRPPKDNLGPAERVANNLLRRRRMS